jgi:hypothetical protein
MNDRISAAREEIRTLATLRDPRLLAVALHVRDAEHIASVAI